MGDQAHKRDPRVTDKYELWANSSKQRTMPMHGIAGTGGAQAWVRYKGRDREGAHGGTGKWGK